MASGDTLVIFTPASVKPPATNAALFGTRNQHLILGFDDTTAWEAIFHAVLPRNYNGGGITVKIGWSAETATSGTVVWRGRFERHESDATGSDMDADSFAAGITSGALTTASATGEIIYSELVFTDGALIDNLSVGESFRFSLDRRPADGNDNMTNDAQLRTIEFRET